MTPVRQPGFNLDSSQGQPSPQDGATARPARKTAGFVVPINPDTGEIDVTRLSPEKLAKLQTASGGKPEEKRETPKPKVEVKPELIEGFYSLLEMGIQKAGKWLLKWPPQLAVEMHFSPDKKAALIAPTKALADEFAPLWLAENQHFIAFGAALTAAVDDMVEKAGERYISKVLRGEAPPPPGFKFSAPPPRSAASPPIHTPPDLNPLAPPTASPANGAAKPDTTTVTGAKGFVPTPSGAGL